MQTYLDVLTNDDLFVEAMYEVIEAMPLAAHYQLHVPHPDGTMPQDDAAESSFIEARGFKIDMVEEPGFVGEVWWEVPNGLGAPTRYLRMKIVPEGIAVIHYSDWVGTTVISLPGMPVNKSTTSPKVTYITASRE